MRVVFLIFSFFISIDPGFSYGGEQSSWRTDIYENPYLSLGYDIKSKLLTGFLAALRTAPGETNECKLFFKGEGDSRKIIAISIADVTSRQSSSNRVNGQLEIKSNNFKLTVNRSQLPGDCDWVLPFVGYPAVEEKNGQILVTISPTVQGDWRAVGVVQAKKAYFHQAPDETTVQKAYLVSGDILHIYDEMPGWYFVKFKGRKKEVVGWVKVRDTIQF